MQILARRSTGPTALAGVGMVLLGLAIRTPAVVGWGGAVLVALLAARELTRLTVLRARLAGLEMRWRAHARAHSVLRSAPLRLPLQFTNRDHVEARVSALTPVASNELSVQIEPRAGAIAPGGTLRAEVVVTAKRVGRYAIHGVTVELEGPLGLFAVPLGFASPLGIEVLPNAAVGRIGTAYGGRSRRAAASRVSRNDRGDGTELFELRDHVAGDPFKRIAWKASARRGQLLVKELEREEREVVWLVLDSAVDLWAGPTGRAPLDRGIEEVAALALRHLALGDRVGLTLAGTLPEETIAPAAGPAHSASLLRRLAFGASTLAADRSDWTEAGVARAVLEHLRFLDGSNARLAADQVDAIATSADAQRKNAPFDVAAPWAPTPRERQLRRYLACFGLTSPPRAAEGRAAAEQALARAIEEAQRTRPRATVVYVWGPPPEGVDSPVVAAIRRVRRRGTTVHWIPAARDLAVDAQEKRGGLWAPVAYAVRERARLTRESGERILRAEGVRLHRPRSAAERRDDDASVSASFSATEPTSRAR